MNFIMILAAMLLPLLGTMLGGCLFLFDKKAPLRPLFSLNAFAAGVMCAASVWSLLLPALSLSPAGIAAGLGLFAGGLIMVLCEKCLHRQKKDGSMLFLAVTLHNIPEGLAVGVALSGLWHAGTVSLSGALLLSFGIALQNIPEGAIIYAPMRAGGCSRKKALLFTLFSGVVEPLAALPAFLLTGLFQPVLPFVLSLAAGAMLFVSADELIPAARQGTRSSLPGLVFILGFGAMMLLDVLFG